MTEQPFFAVGTAESGSSERHFHGGTAQKNLLYNTAQHRHSETVCDSSRQKNQEFSPKAVAFPEKNYMMYYL